MTLPDATDGSMTGFATIIMKTDNSANAVTIDTAAETINGAASYALNKQYDSVLLVSDAANWLVAGGKSTTLSSLTVEGASTLSGAVSLKAGLDVSATAAVGLLAVAGTSTMVGAVVMKANVTVNSGARLDVQGEFNVGTLTASATAVFKSAVVVEGAANTTITTLTPAATVAPDFSASNDFTLTLDQNTTLGQPTNQTVGQSGVIYIIQDSTARTLGFHADWKFADGTDPTITTGSGDVNVLAYHVRAANSIITTFVGGAFA